MRLFLDECVIPRFGELLIGHDWTTSRDVGWLTLPDPEVLRRARGTFDCIITTDRRFAGDDTLVSDDPAVMILRARHNSLSNLAPLVPLILEQLSTIRPGRVYVIDGRR